MGTHDDLPECVTRWREANPRSREVVEDDLAYLSGPHDLAAACLRWIAATPNHGAVVVAASSASSDKLRQWVREQSDPDAKSLVEDLKRERGKDDLVPQVLEAVASATILDRHELVELMTELRGFIARMEMIDEKMPARLHSWKGDTLRQIDEVRALLDGEDS